MGQDLSTIVRDLPVEFDLEAARLGDYDRETVIRLFREYEFRTLIERLPAMTGETAGDAAEAPARRRDRRVGAGGARRRLRAAGGWGPARPTRPPPDGGGLQLSLDFDAVSRRPAGRAATGDGRRRRRRRADEPDRRAERPADRAGRRDRRPGPDRGPRRRPDRAPSSRGWRPSRRSASGSLLDDPRPRRGAPLALAVAGADGRTVAVERPGGRRRRCGACSSGSGPRSSATRSSRCSSPRIADDPDATADAGRLRHPDRGVHPQRRAPQPDDRRRRRRAARPDPAAGRRARRAGAGRARGARRRSPSASRSSVASARKASTACSARSSCRSSPSSPGWRRPASPSISTRSASWRREFGAEISRLEAEIYADVGHEFNLGSPKQLEQVLFFELNLPKGKRTKTGYSTDASVLEDLRPAHPMIDKLLEWRVYTKLRSTYVEALPTLIAADGRLHTTFHQAVAATGPPVVVRPEPPEHPDPDAARPAHPPRVRGRRPGPDARRRRLQPDRAAHPRPRLGRRAPARRVRARGRHPSRDRRARAPQGPGRRHRSASGRWPRWSTSGSPTG